jgi:2-polyprenyl-6-methoxyphenol hydroxylase-like FAD-dependent oxidoreductase
MTATTSPQATHAVVLGASTAGLLAARVLAERHARVTLVDRDPVAVLAGPRRGVPQGRHIHVLHPRGLQILDELFPGLADALAADGAVPADLGRDVRAIFSGHHLRQAPLGLRAVLCSRPFLEDRVRARVLGLPNVTVRHAAVAGLIGPTPDRRVTGVRVVPNRGGQESVMLADLVVDATGRGSHLPAALEQLGYRKPAEDRVEIGLAYATRLFRLRPGALGQDVAIVQGATPGHPRSGFLAQVEGGRHLVGMAGVLGDLPPVDLAGFTAFAASPQHPDIAEALVGAEPLDDGVTIRFPVSVRRRYERLPDLPAGLLAAGDGVCSFNPVYGQGMTVAALEAVLLRDLLARELVPDPRRWFRAAARVVDAPWQVSVGADLAFPDVVGRRTVQVRLANAYLPRLHAAATTDAELATAFARVVGLLDPPAALMRPDRLARAAAGTLRQRVIAHRARSGPGSPGTAIVGSSRDRE